MNISDNWIKNYRNRIERNRKLFFEKTQRPFVTRDAMRKFDSSGKPKSFYGWSLVYFTTPEHQIMTALAEKQRRLLQLVQSSGISRKFAFLPLATYHMTLVGIATNQPLSIEREIVKGVEESFNLFKTQPIHSPIVQIRGDLSPDGSTIIAPVEPIENESLQTIYHIRDLLRRKLHPLGEDIVRNTPQNFHGHITLAYIINPLSEEDYTKVKEILQMFHSSQPLGIMRVDTMSLHHFRTMVDWGRPLQKMRLPVGKI